MGIEFSVFNALNQLASFFHIDFLFFDQVIHLILFVLI